MYSSQSSSTELVGKAANAYYGFLSPALFGKTSFQISDNRITEKTKKIVASRYCQVLLSEVDSVEIVEDGVSWLLVLGLSLLLLYGIGIIFLILYFFFKYKYLIIRSGSNTQVLCITGTGGMDRAKAFMSEVLMRSERLKAKNAL